MFKYKRGINNIEMAKKVEFCMSDNLNTYLVMNATLENKKPYHALYIRNNKVILENLVEKIEFNNRVYKCMNFSNNLQNISCDEYMVSIDLDNYSFEYDLGLLKYTKKFIYSHQKSTFIIEYEVTNNSNSNAKFELIPFVTYRDLYISDKTVCFNFNQRKVDDGQLINLSVKDNENLVLKSDFCEFVQEVKHLKNVKREFIDDDYTKNVFLEDLFIPGSFLIDISPNTVQRFNIIVTDKNFNINDFNYEEEIKKYNEMKDSIFSNIKEEFTELKDLAITINNLDLEEKMYSSLPNIIKELDIDNIINIAKSIEGAYLILNKEEKAKLILNNVKKYIDSIKEDNQNNEEKIILLKLWFIESVNRLYQRSKVDLDILFNFVKEEVEDLINNKYNFKKYLNNIEVVALWYNALKIYENMLSKNDISNEHIYFLAEEIKEKIVSDFWDDKKRLMKCHLDEEETKANISMIYVLSLSYQANLGDIPIKLLDSIFKELYTPYGLRKTSKLDSNYNGLLYPEYMAYFVKANLRQNGVTRASQKIAYNLVKELLLDINKYVNGGVKKTYHEKGLNIDNVTYDLLTNAEIIRLYDMLT